MEEIYSNILRKMKVTLDGDGTVGYYLRGDNMAQETNCQPLLGKTLRVQFSGKLFCTSCGKKVKKHYGQGFCYPCFSTSPDNAECIVRPELCRAHVGEGRDPAWEEEHHNKPHYVYLSGTNGVKVGVTRNTQIPTRWIDQGATKAVIIAEVPYRMLAGAIEVSLKEHFADKTVWNKMLTGTYSGDLTKERERAAGQLPEEFGEFFREDEAIVSLNYPLLHLPTKVKSLQLLKTPNFSDVLIGIKGQYLLFESGVVWNVRNHSGYEVAIFL